MFTVVPIDIDFAGWSEVEAGEHNAWGVVKGSELFAHYPVKCVADAKAKEGNEKNWGHFPQA